MAFFLFITNLTIDSDVVFLFYPGLWLYLICQTKSLATVLCKHRLWYAKMLIMIVINVVIGNVDVNIVKGLNLDLLPPPEHVQLMPQIPISMEKYNQTSKSKVWSMRRLQIFEVLSFTIVINFHQTDNSLSICFFSFPLSKYSILFTFDLSDRFSTKFSSK